MGSLFATVIPLALGAALSPAVLTVQLVTLTGRVAPVRRAWVLAAGFALVAVGVCVAAALLAKGTGGTHTSSDTSAIVKLVAAVALLGLGIRALVRPQKPPKPKPDRDRGPRLGEAFGFGAGLMLANVSSIVLIIAAVHEIGIHHAPTWSKVVAVVIVFLCTLVPAVGPPLAVTVLGDRGTRGLDALNRFAAAHRRAIAATVCFAFAAFLAVVALAKLL